VESDLRATSQEITLVLLLLWRLRWETVTQGENVKERHGFIETLPVLLVSMEKGRDDDDDDKEEEEEEKEEEEMGVRVTAAVIGMGVVIPVQAKLV